MPSMLVSGAGSPTITSGWKNATRVWCITELPTARLAANGNRPIIAVNLSLYLGASGGGVTGVLAFYDAAGGSAVGSNTIGPLGTGAPSLVSASIPAGFGVANAAGQAFGVGAQGFGGAGIYRGRVALAGRNVNVDGSTADTNQGLAGAYDYAQVPAAPTGLTVNPLTANSVSVSWTAPDNGGSAITGYRVDVSTSPVFASFTSVSPAGTSTTIGSLTPGTTYYFRVWAFNTVTNVYGTASTASATVNRTLGAVPGAPTGVVVTGKPGLAVVDWVAPASDGGIAIDAYRIEYGTDPTLAALLGTIDVAATARSNTIVGLTPGTTYYARVRAHNAAGYSVASGIANAALPARGTLDIVQSAALHLTNGVQVEVRSDGANAPTLTLGYIPFGTGTAFTAIAALTGFYTPGGARNLTIVTDPSGNLYVIGIDATNTSAILVKRYERTGTNAWVLDGALSQALANTGDPLVAVAATHVPGTGSSAPTPSILVIARRAGTIGVGAVSFATLNLVNLEASAGSLFIASGSDPAWLSTPPSGGTPDTGVVGVTQLVSGGTRLAVLANGFAVVDVVNGVVSSVAKAPGSTTTAGPWTRVVGVSAGAFAILKVVSGALVWTFYSSTGSQLGTGSYAGANAFGGAFTSQWDAYYDRVSGQVTVYYVADNAGARQLENIDINPSTYAASAPVVLTAALGAASSTNAEVRIPERIVDERRVLVAAANLLAGVKSTAAYVDTTGNVAPNAPPTPDVAGFDASNPYTLTWAFGDPNSADVQTAYELQVQRVSDSVNVVNTGKVVSTDLARLIVAATLANAINYRWRVRTWDELDTAGAWSAYDAFTTAALGTLTITNPATDNPPGYDSATVPVTWSYVQADGYVQTQRRVRVIRVSDNAVLSDTTMQASVSNTYTVGVPTGVEVRIEVSVVTNAPGTPTVTTTRLITSDYSTPMAPAPAYTTGESFITVTVVNPTPTGNRPEVSLNIIERRLAGTSDDFQPVAIVGHNGEYNDHAVRSGTAYEYRVRGRSA